MKRYEKLNLNYPKGKIIAKVNLTDCIEVDNNLKSKLKEKNYLVYQGAINSNKKEYAFKLENVEKIEEISIKGKLSFWDYDYKK